MLSSYWTENEVLVLYFKISIFKELCICVEQHLHSRSSFYYTIWMAIVRIGRILIYWSCNISINFGVSIAKAGVAALLEPAYKVEELSSLMFYCISPGHIFMADKIILYMLYMLYSAYSWWYPRGKTSSIYGNDITISIFCVKPTLD